MQPWRFIVIRSPEIKLAVRELAERERLRQAPRMANAPALPGAEGRGNS